MPAARKKTRNAEATRAAIENAARKHFGSKGYDAVGLREIARDAGVDVALISRYYGSKKGLFETAILPHFDISPLVQGGMNTFGQRVAAMMLDPAHKQDFDPTRALLLSIGSGEVGALINEALTKEAIEVLTPHLDGPQATVRAALIIAVLTGVDALFRIARLDALTTAAPAPLGEVLAALAQGLVASEKDRASS